MHSLEGGEILHSTLYETNAQLYLVHGSGWCVKSHGEWEPLVVSGSWLCENAGGEWILGKCKPGESVSRVASGSCFQEENSDEW